VRQQGLPELSPLGIKIQPGDDQADGCPRSLRPVARALVELAIQLREEEKMLEEEKAA